MNDEINKIIQSISDFYKLDNALKYYLDRHKAQIILDYITNLQQAVKDTKDTADDMLFELKQENERLKENLQQEKKDFKEANDYCFELKGYKSRCEKASDKLKRDYYINYNEHNDDVVYEALNILQNGSDSNED